VKIFYLLFLVMTNSVFANNDVNCSAVGYPKINVNVYESPLKQDYIYSKEIESRLTNKNIPAANNALGLFTSDVKWSVRPEYSYFEYGNKNVCANTINVFLEVEYKPTIFLARELMGRNCSSQTVLLHEKEHFNIDKRGLNISIMGAKSSVNKYFSGAKKFNNKNEMLMYYNNASNLINSEIGLMLKNNTDGFQRALDSDAEYARISDSCNGEFKRVMDSVVSNKYFR